VQKDETDQKNEKKSIKSNFNGTCDGERYERKTNISHDIGFKNKIGTKI